LLLVVTPPRLDAIALMIIPNDILKMVFLWYTYGMLIALL